MRKHLQSSSRVRSRFLWQRNKLLSIKLQVLQLLHKGTSHFTNRQQRSSPHSSRNTMFLAENRGFQFAGTHCKMPLPLICMSLSHSLALGVLLRFFSPSLVNSREKRRPENYDHCYPTSTWHQLKQITASTKLQVCLGITTSNFSQESFS